MRVLKTGLAGILMIEPDRFGDHRGFFAETYSQRVYAELGINERFVQDNHSLSAEISTVRGLHFQAPPHAQAKLVRCGRGAIFDVAVDIRKGSATYGKWVGYELSAENGAQLFIPAGFAHGITTLHPIARSSTNARTITHQKPRARYAGMTRQSTSTGHCRAKRSSATKTSWLRYWPNSTARFTWKDRHR